MPDTKQMKVDSLEDELKDSKALNKALTILAGEVSCIMDDMTKPGEAEDFFATMGEASGRRLGKAAKKRFGTIENVEEALDTFIYQTDMWYGYEMELDHIEGDTLYINIFKCFIRDILKDRKLTTESPLCAITRGYLEGAVEELTGKNVSVKIVYGDVNGICREKITIN
ncbi:MAG: hypothetical protein EF813_10565 [Methanosarcinales archaeon]|nr:MAG: hypothetical protein EF813_10565 [Methanosarcinales archaeon]